MSDWVTTAGGFEADPERRFGGRGAIRAGGWAGVAFVIPGLAWLLLFELGLFTTLGSAEGSERHGANLVRAADESSLGLSTMYAGRGQHLWWDYDVTVAGAGGVRLRIAKSPPSAAFVVRAQDIASTGRGRFELIAPESGFYTFSRQLIPQGDLLGNGRAGETRYALNWGID